MPPLPAWHAGRIIVLGDTAHAPTPTSGQGAPLSIEDAVMLAKCLRDLPDAPTAFARFEAARRPRVERIAKTFDYHIDWDAITTAAHGAG